MFFSFPPVNGSRQRPGNIFHAPEPENWGKHIVISIIFMYNFSGYRTVQKQDNNKTGISVDVLLMYGLSYEINKAIIFVRKADQCKSMVAARRNMQ